MKDSRQSVILEIINAYDIETQEELAKYLLERGFKVTQATISRDIKELHLIKIQTEVGVYKYAVNEPAGSYSAEKLMRVFRETVLSVNSTGNLVVISTIAGSANAACEMIDNLGLEGIIGSLAGDNTIFTAVREGMADAVVQKLRSLVK